ncbi:uncharacterized protein LOC134210529 [Armigeres subalbatus]|uniref:uncharacterized protein LOC134210529 n=1 Tax=Armigeres subalbatus TaxID=124917 RepID=UPI002ED1BB1A
MANNRRHGPISVEELNTTLYGILRLVQAEYFGSELSALQGGRPIPPRSKLRYLCPAFQDGLIRVGGRLEHAAVVNDTRKPFVLPRKHPLTWLIATSIHRQQLHCGPQLLLSIIRQQFWPLGGRDLTREVVHKCVICVKTRPRNLVQLMGSLPAVRVTQSYTFENVGIDFAGPFYLQRPSPRSSPKKSYVAVFVCMATKASHLELVCELTTAAFIASLRRFIARRGRPQHIYCDNATNFVGAGREIRNLFRSQQHRHSVSNETSSQSIQFHFIPAKSPNFGGLWEACVKSMKHHLRRVIGSANLPRDAFCTVLAQVEACLNSRPITPLSSDPNDLQALTPGHFLIGRALNDLPNPNYTVIPENRLRLWERVQRHTQQFWKRWHQEYLTTLQQRYKWSTVNRNLIVGAMVMIQEESLPVLKWSLGRVVDIHPGADGMVRVATVKLPSGTFTKRSISRLCILPVEIDPAILQGSSQSPRAGTSTHSTGSSGDPGHLSASAGAAGPTHEDVSSEDD